MINKTTSLHSTFSVNGEVSNDDTRFLNITIDVLHTGENLNGSIFTKEVVDSCIDSIKNTPVLGYIKYDRVAQEKDFKGHEHVLTRTENGVEEKYLGSAYGVIPEACNPRWITKTCSDGQEREFLQVDALLWEKFSDSTYIVNRDGEKAESMELEVSSVEGYEDDDGVFHFEKFRFDGCCILGNDVEPAMTDANVKLKGNKFVLDDFTKEIQSELNDKFMAFTKLVNDKNGQGGVGNMSDIDTNIDTDANTDFAQTVLSQFEDISNIVSEYATMKNRWDEDVPRFYVVDVQDDEVIAVDMQDNYHYVGFKFSIDGDKPVIDFDSISRKKISFSDYEDGTSVHEGSFDFGKYISDVEDSAFAKVSDAEAKVVAEANEKAKFETDYNAVKAELDEIKPKYDEFMAADEQRKADELTAQKDAKFAEYEDVLSDNAEFEALKEQKDDMSVEDIEKECAVIYVKASRAKSKFSKQSSNIATAGVLDDEDENDDANCWVSAKYGKIRICK